MIASNLTPSIDLKPYVTEYRLRHFGSLESPTDSFKPYPPRPEQCISFYIRGAEKTRLPGSTLLTTLPTAVVTGQFTQRVDRFVAGEFLMITVVFRPGILHRLTGIPIYQLHNSSTDLESVFPRKTKRLSSQLNSAESYLQMVALIEKFIRKLLAEMPVEARPFDAIFDLIATRPQAYTLDWLAAQSYLSYRQFERIFKNYIGVSPKTFQRISRLEQSYQLRLKNTNARWLSIAMACGYQDYQHLSKEYELLTQCTPNQFFALEEKAPGRQLGLTKPGKFNWLK